jgi:hypothetical protein
MKFQVIILSCMALLATAAPVHHPRLADTPSNLRGSRPPLPGSTDANPIIRREAVDCDESEGSTSPLTRREIPILVDFENLTQEKVDEIMSYKNHDEVVASVTADYNGVSDAPFNAWVAAFGEFFEAAKEALNNYPVKDAVKSAAATEAMKVEEAAYLALGIEPTLTRREIGGMTRYAYFTEAGH